MTAAADLRARLGATLATVTGPDGVAFADAGATLDHLARLTRYDRVAGVLPQGAPPVPAADAPTAPRIPWSFAGRARRLISAGGRRFGPDAARRAARAMARIAEGRGARLPATEAALAVERIADEAPVDRAPIDLDQLTRAWRVRRVAAPFPRAVVDFAPSDRAESVQHLLRVDPRALAERLEVTIAALAAAGERDEGDPSRQGPAVLGALRRSALRAAASTSDAEAMAAAVTLLAAAGDPDLRAIALAQERPRLSLPQRAELAAELCSLLDRRALWAVIRRDALAVAAPPESARALWSEIEPAEASDLDLWALALSTPPAVADSLAAQQRDDLIGAALRLTADLDAALSRRPAP